MIFSRSIESLAWLGSAVGAAVLARGAIDISAVHPLIAAANPTEVTAAITAYSVAICGAVLTLANTALAVYQRFRRAQVDAATLEAAKLEAIAKLVAARLKAKAEPRLRRKSKSNVDPTPKPDS